MKQQSYFHIDQNPNSLMYDGKIIAEVRKVISKVTQRNQVNRKLLYSRSPNIKLKSVSKNFNIIQNKQKNQINFDYFLFIYQSKHDHIYFKQYVKQLTQNTSVYKFNLMIVQNVQQFNEKLAQVKATHCHKTFALLVGQFGVINYRQLFKQIDQIIVLIDNEEKYSSLSYLMKQINIKSIIYDYSKLDCLLKNMMILSPDIKVDALPSIVCQKKRQIRSKNTRIDSDLMAKVNLVTKSPSNKQNIVFRGQVEAAKKINLLTTQSLNKEKKAGVKDMSQKPQKQNSSEYLPRQSILGKKRKSSNQRKVPLETTYQSSLQTPQFRKNITFGNQQSNIAVVLFMSDLSISQNHFRDIEDNCRVTFQCSGLESELRRVALQQKNSQINLSQNTIQRGKKKVSLPWYKKYLKKELNNRMRQIETNRKPKPQDYSDGAKTAQVQFYKKRDVIRQEEDGQYEQSQQDRNYSTYYECRNDTTDIRQKQKAFHAMNKRTATNNPSSNQKNQEYLECQQV